MKSIIKKRMQENNLKCSNAKLTPVFPKNMLLEVTNICNHECVFCANAKSTRKRGLLDVNIGQKLLKEAYDCGAREVGFYATGEPLVHPELETFIKCAKEIGYTYVYITTNGALLDEKRGHALIEAGIDSVKFSINASNKKDYAFVHGKDDFNKIVDNIKQFDILRRNCSKKIKLFVSCILTDQTKNIKEEARNVFSEYVDDILFLDCGNQGGYMYEINETVALGGKANFWGESHFCPLIFNNLYISYEGYLTLCCTDFQNYLVVSDLKEESLKDAWHNEYAQKLRKCHIENNLEGTLCYNCVYNCETEVAPLREQYGISFDYKEFNQKNCIEDRIQKWKERI